MEIMNVKIKLLFKYKVILVLLIIAILVFGGIIFTSVRSLKLDKKHLGILEDSKNLDLEISHSRIYLDDYYLLFDTLKRAKVISSFEKAEDYISRLSSFHFKINGKKEVSLGETLILDVTKVSLQVELLKSLVTRGFDKDLKSIDKAVLIEYNNFQDIYLNFDDSLHEYIVDENSDYRLEVFILLVSIFGILVLCLVVIFRLIIAYHTMETQQVIKTIEVEYNERKRIAADLHDGLGSILSSIALYVKLIEKDFFSKKVNGNLEQVKQLSNIALDNLETIINNLNPSALNRYGLIKSIEILCGRIRDIGKIDCHLHIQNFDFELPKNIELNIYRICSELINNTLKHSEATELTIDIRKLKKTVILSCRDNGKGFNTDLIYSNEEEKMGLRNIINRIESLGGKYEINSAAGKGVEFILRFNVSN